MASEYTFETPPGATTDDGVIQFFKNFYHISDSPGAHDEYTNQFTDNATLIMASKSAKGSQDIKALREGMWSLVSSRRHTVHKIFPFGSGSREVMLYGVVKYGLKDGRGAEVDWAARAVLAEGSGDASGNLKLSFYQVYLDTAAAANAK